MENENSLLSIIVPVYNVEEYLNRCMESLAGQSYSNIQLILVDDGSTDQSGRICDEWAAKSSRITVYHKPNGGLSDARNYGLSKAEGEYVMFVDSDDYISSDAASVLMQDALNFGADVVIGHSVLLNPSKAMDFLENIIRDNFEYHKIYSGKDYMEKCLAHGGLRMEVWRNLYRRKFLLSNGLMFRKGIYHEDEEFTPRMFLAAEKVVLNDCAFYFYDNSRTESITNSCSISKEKARDLMLIFEELSGIYSKVTPKKLRRYLQDDICWKYLDVICRYRMLDEEDFVPMRKRTLFQAYKLKRRVKALIFAVSPKLFCKMMTKLAVAEVSSSD